MQLTHLFRALVVDGALLTTVGCTGSAVSGIDSSTDTDLDTVADTDTDTDVDTDTDTDVDTDTAPAECPDTCDAADYALGDETDWSTCFPESTVCCWMTGECCDLCCPSE